MNVSQYPIFALLPRLSDEAATSIFDFLNELIYQFEAEYGSALRRSRDDADNTGPPINQLDLFDHPDDPPF